MYGVSDRYGVINGGPPRLEEVRAWSLSLARALADTRAGAGTPPRVVKRTNIRAHGHGNRPLDIHTDRLVCFAA